MKIEINPTELNKVLISEGLSESQVRIIGAEFKKKDGVISDDELLEKLMEFNRSTFSIISIFERVGIGRDTAIRLIAHKEKSRLGHIAEVVTLEVED